LYRKIIAGACAAAGLAAGASHAAGTTQLAVDASNLGWYNSTGAHLSYNNNTLTGMLGVEYRSFYEWTLPTFAGHVTGAHLEMALPYSLGVDQGTQTGAMFDVAASDLPYLTLTDGAGQGTLIFADLGSGTSYGTFTISEADAFTTFRIDLDAAAISALDAANGGTFALGMRNTTVDNTNNSFLFSSMSTAGEQTLVLDVTPVPEASSYATMLLGAATLLALARRRQA
jgi:hypothetical protein